MPLYVPQYLGQREEQVYLALDDAGNLTETGPDTEISRYRRVQGLSLPL